MTSGGCQNCRNDNAPREPSWEEVRQFIEDVDCFLEEDGAWSVRQDGAALLSRLPAPSPKATEPEDGRHDTECGCWSCAQGKATEGEGGEA